MKKTIRKLVLRKATIRELSGQALSQVIGGLETAVAYPWSHPKQCTGVLAVSPDAYPQSNPRHYRLSVSNTQPRGVARGVTAHQAAPILALA